VSRIVNTDSTGKQRTQLTKAVAVAVRELAQQTESGDEARDLAAFIALALGSIHSGIDSSVAAWEKRGYWVKADRFRMEWAWAGTTSEGMRNAVLNDDWATVAQLSVKTAQKLDGVQVTSGTRTGRPWAGAFERLKAGG
jgi:hypothetical protein